MSSTVDQTTIEILSSTLIDTSLTLKHRFRSLFTLKNLESQGQGQQIENNSDIVTDINDTSALFKHECAYCHDQMGEALGAIRCFENQGVINALTNQIENLRAEISETCQIALDHLE